MSPTRWTPLDLTRPTYHLRCLARGASATGLPLLSLADAAELLGLSSPSSVHTAERREAGRGLAASAPGSCTLASLLERAAAYGLELEVRVRVRR